MLFRDLKQAIFDGSVRANMLAGCGGFYVLKMNKLPMIYSVEAGKNYPGTFYLDFH